MSEQFRDPSMINVMSHLVSGGRLTVDGGARCQSSSPRLIGVTLRHGMEQSGKEPTCDVSTSLGDGRKQKGNNGPVMMVNGSCYDVGSCSVTETVKIQCSCS